MVAPPPPAGGVYFVVASLTDGSGEQRHFVAVMPREEAVEKVGTKIGEGWEVALFLRRPTREQAAMLNLPIEANYIRELTPAEWDAVYQKPIPPSSA